MLSSQTQPKTTDSTKNSPKTKEEPKSNQSFVHNLFRGNVESSQVFPYPLALNQEQIDYVGAFVDPVTKFFTEINDPVKNDSTASIDQTTLDALWELGAFGLQAPEKYGGLALNNTQYGRLAEIIGAHDLGLGICVGAHQSIGFKVSRFSVFSSFWRSRVS